MLGIKRITADPAALVNPAVTSFIPLPNGLLEIGFQVEEEEMLVNLSASVTYTNTVVEHTDFTLFVDGADIETVGTNGIARFKPALAPDEITLYMQRIVRLPQGYHTVEIRVKAPTGDVTFEGGSIPCELVARRYSHPATLGHGVDSKVQVIQ